MEKIEILSIEATDPHKEYQQELLGFLKKATKENSVVYEFKFTNKYCYCKTVKYEIDGSNEILDDKTFSNPKEVLLKIIEPFLKEFANQNEIVINQILPKSNNRSDLKIISNNNDMCNIVDIEEEKVTKLSELVDHEKKNQSQTALNQENSEQGSGNVVAFIISLITVGILILGMLVPDFLG